MIVRVGLLIITAASVLTGCVTAPTGVEPLRWTVGKSISAERSSLSQVASSVTSRPLARLERGKSLSTVLD
jgi:starvation-inducible outer membrane lipoprotein